MSYKSGNRRRRIHDTLGRFATLLPHINVKGRWFAATAARWLVRHSYYVTRRPVAGGRMAWCFQHRLDLVDGCLAETSLTIEAQ
jgi:hypothetical protein